MTAVNWSNITTVSDFLSTANTNSGGYFWVTMMYTFMIIIFMALVPIFGFEAGALVALFSGLLVGMLLLNLGLVGFMWVGIPVGLLLFLIVFFIFKSPGNQQ